MKKLEFRGVEAIITVSIVGTGHGTRFQHEVLLRAVPLSEFKQLGKLYTKYRSYYTTYGVYYFKCRYGGVTYKYELEMNDKEGFEQLLENGTIELN